MLQENLEIEEIEAKKKAEGKEKYVRGIFSILLHITGLIILCSVLHSKSITKYVITSGLHYSNFHNWFLLSCRGKRTDIDDEDDQESYFNAIKDGTIVPYPDEEDQWDYDSDGNPIPPEKSKVSVITSS